MTEDGCVLCLLEDSGSCPAVLCGLMVICSLQVCSSVVKEEVNLRIALCTLYEVLCSVHDGAHSAHKVLVYLLLLLIPLPCQVRLHGRLTKINKIIFVVARGEFLGWYFLFYLPPALPSLGVCCCLFPLLPPLSLYSLLLCSTCILNSLWEPVTFYDYD
ncbi:hypothetical protein RIF29_06129 [Crotalaria pallida]|uniref:Uncharacterized protein n=1 Tax=Crotalaria pallida TaxID=3830 RepID=A0AAN9J349_CROPI